MGQSKSKALKHQQYPHHPGYPQYAPVYPYGVPPPPVGYAPAPGYQVPVIPPGYAVGMPQPVVNWPPQPQRRKRRKKDRKTSTGHAPAQQQPDQQRSAVVPANVQPAPAGMLEGLPPGFIPTNIAPNPPGVSISGPVIPPGVNTAQGAPPPPLFTPGVPGEPPLTNFPSSEPQRRTATPFMPAFPPVDSSDDDDDDSSEQENRAQRHHSRSHRRGGSNAQHHLPFFQPVQPDDPIASPGIAPNPLPPPPRDLYATSPYKQLLHLPTTNALITATMTNQNSGFPNPNVTVVRSGTNPGMAGIGAGINAAPQQNPTLRKKKRGLFSFGSRRRAREPEPEPAPQQQQQHPLGNIHFVPIYRDAPPPGASGMGGGTVHPQGGTPIPPVPTPPSARPQRSPPQHSPPRNDLDDDESSEEEESPPPGAHRTMTPVSHHSRSHHQSHPSQSQPRPLGNPPPQPTVGQPYLVSANGSVIEFSQTSLPDFLNHSPHHVTYHNRMYPTAMHLHEAMKFMDHKPELAENIRNCPSVEEVYPLAASLLAWVRPDWGRIFLDKMEEVLWYKFTQHRDLRTMLLKTGNAHLVYADLQDPYWGSGSQFGQAGDYSGSNYLGKLLEKVRERLRHEGLS